MTNLYFRPENVGPITEIYAVVSVDAEGREGICGKMAQMGMQPLVCTNHMKDVDKLPEWAEMIARDTKLKVRVIKFTCREELKTFG